MNWNQRFAEKRRNRKLCAFKGFGTNQCVGGLVSTLYFLDLKYNWAPCLLCFCLLRDCQIIRNNLKSALEYACWLDDMSGMRRMPQQLCKERFAQILVALKRQPYIYQSYGIPVLTILQIVRSFFTQMSHPENEERNKYEFSIFLCRKPKYWAI